MNSTWEWPLLLAATTALGLASGIFGAGIWDWVCWAGLLMPVLIVGQKLLLQWRGHVRNRKLLPK